MSLKKTVHRLLAAAAALVMALTVVTPAFAATITVNSPAGDTDFYTAYKLFDVESNEGETAYTYSTRSKQLADALGAANLGITMTKAANVDIWYVSGLESDDTQAAADLAQYIHTNWDSTFKSLIGMNGYKSTKVDDGSVIIDTDADTGYFFVTSSLGSLCALNTVQTEETINEKNTVPSIDKLVKEDGTSGDYADKATIDITDNVDFQLKVNTGSNSADLGTGIDKNYEITDQLPEGFSLPDGFQLKVYVGNPLTGSWTNEGDNPDYSFSYSKENRTLTITLLSSGKLGKVAQETDIYIEYTATVSDPSRVVIAGDGNTNTATLEYGDQFDDDDATVFTYEVSDGFVKLDGASEDKAVPLAGATFVVSRENDGKTQYAMFNNGILTGWADSEDAEGTALLTDSDGHITAQGLDDGTYTLKETAAPAGYNLLKDNVTMIISDEGEVTYKYVGSTSEAGNELKVVDETGSTLPSTGGMGTTALYAVGAVLVVGAGVTLVVRRRAHHEA